MGKVLSQVSDWNEKGKEEEPSSLACMLGTQMNRWIDTNVLKENSIIRLDRVTVNTIDKRNGR